MPLSIIVLAASALASPATIRLSDALTSPTCVACDGDAERIRGAYSQSEWHAMAEGEILTSEVRAGDPQGAPRARVGAVGRIAHPPSRVWTVLTDFASRPHWQSDTKEVRIVRTEGNRVWVTEHLRFFLVNVRFRVINTLEPERGSIRWLLDQSVAHDIGGTTGSWQLTPLDGGRHTLVAYRSWIDTGQPVPGFLESFLLGRSLPDVVRQLRTEVDERFGADY